MRRRFNKSIYSFRHKHWTNIREVFYAHSKADFVSKLQIALKECYETEYWIELIIDGGYHNNREIQDNCIELKKMLIA